MCKLVVVFLVVVSLTHLVLADFYFQRYSPKKTELKKLNLKCMPGRTVMVVEQKKGLLDTVYSDEDRRRDFEDDNDDDGDKALRVHMSFTKYSELTRDESCKMCVCSAEGKDEYCSTRPAANVNECLRMATLTKEWKSSAPYPHERDLSYRIRRQFGTDYIWHRDEIPYDPKAKCYRGTSFYSNNENAADTDIDVRSDVESLLAYNNDSVCFYCVCATHGNNIGCIPRDPYFCDYYRFLNHDEKSIRDVYTQMYGQDVPAYFRTLSQRVRRTMDDGIFDFIDTVSTGKQPEGDCVPYVSEYTDCTEATQCTGCTKCTCSSEHIWVCNKVTECPGYADPMDANTLDGAFDALLYEVKNRQIVNPPNVLIKPTKRKQVNDVLLDKNEELDQKILGFLARHKRSLTTSRKENKKSGGNDDSNKMGLSDHDEDVHNGTIKFHNTVDELNEDTLTHSNISGTVEAQKVDLNTYISRRSGKENTTYYFPFQIKHNKPLYSHIDNKIDGNASDISIKEQELLGIVTNQTQSEKDAELSKIVVNELKVGKEIIGDEKAPVMSNITFTPNNENDTLTAMAFIAGNLLNKLWSIEKESGDESLEIEAMKTEKLQDLLELFKEPLSMRQEAFLKNALESLSKAIDKHKDGKNISICESIDEARQFIEDSENLEWDASQVTLPSTESSKNVSVSTEKSNNSIKKDPAAKAVEKLTNVMALMKKYDEVNRNLNDLKKGKIANKNSLRKNEKEQDSSEPSLNLFGRVLNKISKLLLPYKNAKKVTNKIKNINILTNKDSQIKNKIKDMFNVDIGNTSLTVKDKLILDYLTKIKNSPRVLLDENYSDDGTSPNLEGDILLNLSEFFKIKSTVDLVKLLDDKKPQRTFSNTKILRHAAESTTTEPTKYTNQGNSDIEVSITKQQLPTTETPKKFANAKEKLKTHLKTILDDIVELQKETGLSGKDGELRLADALPCIYNILNSNKPLNGLTESTIKPYVDKYERIKNIFDELKKELKNTIVSSNRRSYKDKMTDLTKTAPDSALIWARVINNVEKQKLKSARRNLDIKPPLHFEQVKKKMDTIIATSSSDTYKTFTKVSQVLLADRLMLLKALHAEIVRGFDTLKDIRSSFDIIQNLPVKGKNDVKDFLDNFAEKVDINKKVMEDLRKINESAGILKEDNINHAIAYNVPQNEKIESMAMKLVEHTEAATEEPRNKEIKLLRQDVLNQLIKNRVVAFMKVATENDPNYNIAKNILVSLEIGNNDLARQLFKIFVTTKQQTSANVVNDKMYSEKAANDKVLLERFEGTPSKLPVILPNILNQAIQQTIYDKEPVVKFEDPRSVIQQQLQSAGRDAMLRQLLAFKNRGVMI